MATRATKAQALPYIHESLRSMAVPITTLVPDAANAKKHGQKSIDAIKGCLSQYGQRTPIGVQRNGMIVRKGNGTLAAAIALGWTHIACVVLDDDNITAIGYAIADNRSAELAEWDGEALSALMPEVEVGDELLKQMYADLCTELTRAGQYPAPEVIEDEPPLPPAEAITQPGDLWTLGNHRLLCGDSSKPDDVDRLLAGAPIHLVNTDPPYNVKVEPRSNNAIAASNSSFAAQPKKRTHHQNGDLARHPGKSTPTTKQMRAKDRPLANDCIPAESFEQMLLAWFGNMARVLEPGRSFYIWGGYANCANYPPALVASKLYFSQLIIWDKEHPVLNRKDFMGGHELCFYGWKEGAAHKFYGPANAKDLWHVKKVNGRAMVHLTEKPVELAVLAMQYSSLEGENVLDLFGGSGSTLIAAEQTRRKAFLMELDPPYCDVIVKRFETLTGSKALRQCARTKAKAA